MRDRALPKGDAIALAEVAGIMAAKSAHQMIPLCHPLGLDHVAVEFELNAEDDSATVICTASTTARTGVEMEALAGVSGALLAMYDLAKNVEPALAIRDIRLLRKEGGKSGVWRHPQGVPAPLADRSFEGGPNEQNS